MNDRPFAAFSRWLDLAFPRAYGAAPALDEAARRRHWEASARLIAARLILAGAREGILDATIEGSALMLRDRGERLLLPLARVGELALHSPDLGGERAPIFEGPDEVLARLGPAFTADPAALDRLRGELEDSVFNLAVARASADARARAIASGAPWPAPLDPENLIIDGHPWHPMCKTRIGLTRADVLRHAPENLSQGTFYAFDVDEALIQRCGDAEAWLRRLFPPAARGFVRLPVHAAQRAPLRRLFPGRFGRSIVPAPIPPRRARALLSLRTVAVDDAATHVKLALAVITTSARRTVSAMSVANGPPLTRLLATIQAGDPGTRGLAILGDQGAAGLRGERFGEHAAHLGVILRASPEATARAIHGPEVEVWVAAALGERRPAAARTLLAELADRQGSAAALLDAYVLGLVPPLLRLLGAHGLALEAHLQNTLVIVGPRGLVGFMIRDLGGVRIHRPRLRAAGHAIDVAPGSFIITDDLDEVRDKLAHTLFHAHLAAVFRGAEEALGVPAIDGWARVRAVLDHRRDDDPAGDRRALLAERVRSKSLLRMRIDQRISEYTYTRVDNILADPRVIARAEALAPRLLDPRRAPRERP